MLSEPLRARVLDPPIVTADLPGIGGVMRSTVDDFRVTELAAYEPDGRAGHLFVPVTKRGLSTHEAVQRLASHLGISPRDIGTAGRKDRDAVTRQLVSVPAAAAEKLGSFADEAMQLGPARPHGHKLRMGHLAGNRFEIVLRQLQVEQGEARARLDAKLQALAERGTDNVYGPQRFGRDGISLDEGLRALAQGRSGRRGNMTVAAGQAGLFNLYVLLRTEAGLRRTVLVGDLLQKTDTGGMFECEDPALDQPRLDAGAVELTGPIFGSKMRSPAPGTASADLEARVLEAAGVSTSALQALGRGAQGSRRRLDLRPQDLRAEVHPDPAGLRARLTFALPPGAYATRVCAELMRGS